MTAKTFERAPGFLAVRVLTLLLASGLAVRVVQSQEVFFVELWLGLGLTVIVPAWLCVSAFLSMKVHFDPNGMSLFSKALLRWDMVREASFNRDVLILEVSSTDGSSKKVRVPLGQFRDRAAVLAQVNDWVARQRHP